MRLSSQIHVPISFPEFFLVGFRRFVGIELFVFLAKTLSPEQNWIFRVSVGFKTVIKNVQIPILEVILIRIKNSLVISYEIFAFDLEIIALISIELVLFFNSSFSSTEFSFKLIFGPLLEKNEKKWKKYFESVSFFLFGNLDFRGSHISRRRRILRAISFNFGDIEIVAFFANFRWFFDFLTELWFSRFGFYAFQRILHHFRRYSKTASF